MMNSVIGNSGYSVGEKKVTFKSSLDGTEQPMYLYIPANLPEGKVPLVVALHSWSYGYEQPEPRGYFQKECDARGWILIYPDFRGRNDKPAACGSDLAVQDTVDAVNFVREKLPIDDSRIYVAGGSGGGHFGLLLAARHPEIWAGVYSACPISDIGRWHDETEAFADWRKMYADMMKLACGGTPADKPEEYAHRSPLPIMSAAKNVPIHICEGIHDGHTGSVPVGQSIRAYNALAAEEDRVSDKDIETIERTETVPQHLAFKGEDPFFGPDQQIYLRLISGNVCLTLFEGGHAGNYASGADFLCRQVRGQKADWTLPETGTGTVNNVTK